MDELTLLRRLDGEAPAPTVEAVDDAFAALEQRMAAAEQAARKHTPAGTRRRAVRLRRAGLVGLGAVALVVALVATGMLGVAGLGPGANAQAAELLDRAAQNTIRTVDPVLKPGQFRQITTTRLNFPGTDNARGQEVVWSDLETAKLWIPADEQDVWTEARYPFHLAGQYYGPDAKATAEHDPTYRPGQKPQVVRGKAGTQWGDEPQWTPSGVQALPRDPHVLLQYVYVVTIGHGQSPAGEAFVFFGDLLRSGLVPADLRASVYRAVALIPGVTVTAHSATLDGQQGVAFGLDEQTTGIRSDLIIDPDAGDLIGERSVTTRPIDRFPAGVTTDWTSVSTTVVDAVPQKF